MDWLCHRNSELGNPNETTTLWVRSKQREGQSVQERRDHQPRTRLTFSEQAKFPECYQKFIRDSAR